MRFEAWLALVGGVAWLLGLLGLVLGGGSVWSWVGVAGLAVLWLGLASLGVDTWVG